MTKKKNDNVCNCETNSSNELDICFEEIESLKIELLNSQKITIEALMNLVGYLLQDKENKLNN